MPYTQEITRNLKGCFLFLLDQSSSMQEPFGGSGNRKCDELTRSINAWLKCVVVRCCSDAGARDWLDVGVLGYRSGPKGDAIIEPAFAGPLAGRALVSIVEIGEQPARIEASKQRILLEETSEMMEIDSETPIWVDPKAEGGTPLCQALYSAYDLLEPWIAAHERSFPPIVVNFTDGESQDGDPIPYAEALMSLATNDGDVLLFNCHLSTAAAEPFVFPASEETLPDREARTLFRMSSVLPERLRVRAVADGFSLPPGARGMAFNADMVAMVRFLDFGTRVADR